MSSKNSQYVHYPLELRLGEQTYVLTALITHSGILMSRGHYRACVLVGRTWYELDDHKHRRLALDDVLGNEAYLLLYSEV